MAVGGEGWPVHGLSLGSLLQDDPRRLELHAADAAMVLPEALIRCKECVPKRSR
jgi:hypothetical protein